MCLYTYNPYLCGVESHGDQTVGKKRSGHRAEPGRGRPLLFTVETVGLRMGWVWELVRTVAAPPSIVVKCGGGGSSCGRLWCCSCRVVCLVLFLLCVRVTCFSRYEG